MKVLMLWKYYPQYLAYFYEKCPSAASLPFEEHRNKILDDHFGWPADLSRYMNRQGIKTEFIIANAESLQKKWAEENDFKVNFAKDWEKKIAMEQIRRFKPDILWITSIFDYFGDFVKNALPYCKKAVTWVNCPTPKNLDISGFTALITGHPDVFKGKQRHFDDIFIVMPGFDPEILKKIGFVEKRYDIIFIGGVSAAHSKRAEILAYLIKKGVNLKVFGYLSEQKWMFIKSGYQRNVEIIKSVYQNPVFGLDMYRALAASSVSINIHIDVVGNHASNMRMFETTGAGVCLLTEDSENINELFEPGKEVLTYKSKEELLEIIQGMPNNRRVIEQIAKNGQKKTLQSYTMEKMFNDVMPAFNI